MPQPPDRLIVSLRRVTWALAASVATFVPLMQILSEHGWPSVTKPVIAGIVVAVGLCGLCLLPRLWHKRLLFMSVAGLLALGMAELVGSILSAATESSIYEWDERLLYRLRPNSHKTFRRTPINGGERVTVAINSQGFRGPELRTDSTSKRILVCGDSFVEADYSQLENTFVEQLRQELAALTQSDIEAINAGVIGYGPDQVLLRMEQDVPELKPDVVVACFFADNDLGDLLRNKLFRLDDAGELRPHAAKLAPECKHPGIRSAYEPTLWKWTRNAVRGVQSQVAGTESYMDRWLQQCTAEYDDYIVHRDPLVHELQVDHYDADVSLTPNSESARYKAKLFSKILEQMAQVCTRNSAKLCIVIIPSPADLIEDYDFCSIDRKKYPEYDPRAITRVMANAARQNEIPIVNLFDQFQSDNPRELYFRGGDNHWNDLGQQTAAKIVAREIERLGPTL